MLARIKDHFAYDDTFQPVLDAIGAQHEQKKVNRWIPPSLIDKVPLMPCQAWLKHKDGRYYPECQLSRWLCRMLTHRAYVQGEEAYLTREEVELAKEGGIKFELIQERQSL